MGFQKVHFLTRAEKRRMLAAKTFASQASKQMSNQPDPYVLAFLELSNK